MIKKLLSSIGSLLSSGGILSANDSESLKKATDDDLVHIRFPPDTPFPEAFHGTWHSAGGDLEPDPLSTILVSGANAFVQANGARIEHDYKLFSSLDGDVCCVELHMNDECEEHSLRYEPRIFGINDPGSMMIGSTEWAEEFHKQL